MINPDRVSKAVSAIEAGDIKIVRMMLKAGVPATHFVSDSSPKDRTSLAHIAAQSGQTEIFELLLAEGADIRAEKTSSWCEPASMLECACSARIPSIEIVRRILKDGQPTQEALNKSLHTACYAHLPLVEELLAAGADPNNLSKSLDSPLILAVMADQEEIAIRLVQAGADASILIKNKDHEQFWKKRLHEAARSKGMNKFLAALPSDSSEVPSGPTRKKVVKPKSIADCWRAIDQWLANCAPDLKLPPGCDWSKSDDQHQFLGGQPAEQIRASLDCHDGTGEFGLIIMPHDAAYTLLSLSDAAAVRKMMRDVCESERETDSKAWWSEQWWPIADNGGGDLLVVDIADEKSSGQVLKFSHETRRTSRYKKSLLELLQRIAMDLQEGLLSYDPDDGSLV